MARLITIFVTLLAASLFAWAVPLLRLFDAFQPLIVALSIMVAAVFIRLNRGMPALEWKSVDPDRRKVLTAAIVRLSIEYGWIIAIIALTLISLVSLSVIGIVDAATWPWWLRRAGSGLIGGGVGLCLARMAYVVWRDIDIVRLQKQLIDGVASRESDERERELADEKIASIRAAKVRAVEVSPPKAWGES